jgi:hypothetical protein
MLVLHVRSAQISTCAPSAPPGSDHCNVGCRDVAVDVESGATGRGGGTGPTAMHVAPESA